MGDWPWLGSNDDERRIEDMLVRQFVTICPIPASTNSISSSIAAVGVCRIIRVAACYTFEQFLSDLTAWKFMPKRRGTGALLPPRCVLPLIQLSTAFTFRVS